MSSDNEESRGEKRSKKRIEDNERDKNKKLKTTQRHRDQPPEDNINMKKRSRRSGSKSPPISERHDEPTRRYWHHDTQKGEQNNTRKDYVLGERYYGNSKKDNNNSGIKKEEPERKPKSMDMLNTRTGGAYIPPAKLRMMQAEITDKTSAAYQRIAWEALKKSIHGHINKINIGNIAIIIKELLRENVVRGRGLLSRSIIQAQAASPTFTHVYAALVAALNSRFPNIGELLLKRLIIQFKRGFKRNDKSICLSAAQFVAHLVNQRVSHEILALELLTLLVESPTDDSVEVAIAFLKECGQKLTEVSAKGVNAIFEMLRNILHDGSLDKRVQYMIEVMFQIRKDGFKDHLAVIEELELVPEDEQFTHLMMLDEATDPQDLLNVFKFDDKYEENEEKYKTLSKEILGSDAESGSESGSDEKGSEEESTDDEEKPVQDSGTIIDNTETNLIALRRTIYLTINSSLDFEECAHKLMKMQLKPGQEIELCHMFLDCCAEQRTYEKFYGLLAQRFCQINKIYIGPFEEIFKDSYSTSHRLDTNRLRNVSKFFAHLFFTDSISWEAMECVRLNEDDTTSSSRIYIKILFQELAEYMGLRKLNDRLRDVTLQEAFAGLFPRDNPKNTRFAINFFTSIGLGGLTDELREHLKLQPKTQPREEANIKVADTSSSSSSSSSDSDNSSSSSSDSSSKESSSDSEEEPSKKSKTKQKVSKSRNENKPGNNKRKKDKENIHSDELHWKEANRRKEKEMREKEDENNKKDEERWGHDMYYQTYGDDRGPGRRNENNYDRHRNENTSDYSGRQQDHAAGSMFRGSERHGNSRYPNDEGNFNRRRIGVDYNQRVDVRQETEESRSAYDSRYNRQNHNDDNTDRYDRGRDETRRRYESRSEKSRQEGRDGEKIKCDNKDKEIYEASQRSRYFEGKRNKYDQRKDDTLNRYESRNEEKTMENSSEKAKHGDKSGERRKEAVTRNDSKNNRHESDNNERRKKDRYQDDKYDSRTEKQEKGRYNSQKYKEKERNQKEDSSKHKVMDEGSGHTLNEKHKLSSDIRETNPSERERLSKRDEIKSKEKYERRERQDDDRYKYKDATRENRELNRRNTDRRR